MSLLAPDLKVRLNLIKFRAIREFMKTIKTSGMTRVTTVSNRLTTRIAW